MSPVVVPHMEKVYSIVRQVYGRSATDDLNDLDVNNVLFFSWMSHSKLQFILVETTWRIYHLPKINSWSLWNSSSKLLKGWLRCDGDPKRDVQQCSSDQWCSLRPMPQILRRNLRSLRKADDGDAGSTKGRSKTLLCCMWFCGFWCMDENEEMKDIYGPQGWYGHWHGRRMGQRIRCAWKFWRSSVARLYLLGLAVMTREGESFHTRSLGQVCETITVGLQFGTECARELRTYTTKSIFAKWDHYSVYTTIQDAEREVQKTKKKRGCAGWDFISERRQGKVQVEGDGSREDRRRKKLRADPETDWGGDEGDQLSTWAYETERGTEHSRWSDKSRELFRVAEDCLTD